MEKGRDFQTFILDSPPPPNKNDSPRLCCNPTEHDGRSENIHTANDGLVRVDIFNRPISDEPTKFLDFKSEYPIGQNV
jgi:hypothetical protein